MRVIRFRDALREAMSEEMRRDERIFLMGEEVAEYNGAYKVSQGMLAEFGEKRIIDSPIAELGFSGIGVGAAMNGLRPIIEFMTWNFAVLAADQIINSARNMLQMSGGQYGCPIVFRGANGSAGQLGATHSNSYDAFYGQWPGLKVISVSNPYDAKGLLKSAIRDDDPVVFMEAEQMYSDQGEVPEEEYLIPIGVANIVKTGSDVTIIAWNKMLKVAKQAAEDLAKEGIDAEVIDPRTIRPMDYDAITNSVKKTNRLIVIDEAPPFGSVASEISHVVQRRAFDYLDAPVIRICGADTPVAYSPILVDTYLPNAEKVVKAAKDIMYINK